MKRLHFNIRIDAPAEKIWDVLLTKETYETWAAAFMEGSTFETDWKKGSKALFVDSKGSGMVSEIDAHIPNEYLSIHHKGVVRDGVEDIASKEATQYAGYENYTLRSVDGKTEWLVECDMPEEYEEFFNKAWPAAMKIVKELAEQ